MDIYKELKTVRSEELLDTLVWGYSTRWLKSPEFLDGMKHGFRVAGKSGWELVPPAWLREYRKYLKSKGKINGKRHR